MKFKPEYGKIAADELLTQEAVTNLQNGRCPFMPARALQPECFVLVGRRRILSEGKQHPTEVWIGRYFVTGAYANVSKEAYRRIEAKGQKQANNHPLFYIVALVASSLFFGSQLVPREPILIGSLLVGGFAMGIWAFYLLFKLRANPGYQDYFSANVVDSQDGKYQPGLPYFVDRPDKPTRLVRSLRKQRGPKAPA